MPYRDRGLRRQWSYRQRVLCPLCPNLMWPDSERCRDCYLDAVRTAKPALKERRSGQTGVGRPQPREHPWRRSLTRGM